MIRAECLIVDAVMEIMEGFFLFHAQLVLSQHHDTVEPKNKQPLLLSFLLPLQDQKQHGLYYLPTATKLCCVWEGIFTVVVLIKQTRQAPLYKHMLK